MLTDSGGYNRKVAASPKTLVGTEGTLPWWALLLPACGGSLFCDGSPLIRRQRSGSCFAAAHSAASAAFNGRRVLTVKRIGLNRIANREVNDELRQLVRVARTFRPHQLQYRTLGVTNG